MPQGFYSYGPDGTYTLLLVRDALDDAPRRRIDRPLEPLADRPLRHVIHLRVFWVPRHGVRADHPAAANAAIDWYILSSGAEAGADLLHYEGAGFVSLTRTRRGLQAEIRNAGVSPMIQRGRLTDPFGRAGIAGRLVLQRDDRLVEQTLAELRAAAAERVAEAERPSPE